MSGSGGLSGTLWRWRDTLTLLLHSLTASLSLGQNSQLIGTAPPVRLYSVHCTVYTVQCTDLVCEGQGEGSDHEAEPQEDEGEHSLAHLQGVGGGHLEGQ